MESSLSPEQLFVLRLLPGMLRPVINVTNNAKATPSSYFASEPQCGTVSFSIDPRCGAIYFASEPQCGAIYFASEPQCGAISFTRDPRCGAISFTRGPRCGTCTLQYPQEEGSAFKESCCRIYSWYIQCLRRVPSQLTSLKRDTAHCLSNWIYWTNRRY